MKESAARSVELGIPVADVARACSVHANSVRRWHKELQNFGEQAFPGCGRSRASRSRRSETLVFRLTPDEYERLQAASAAGGARSLSEFARGQVFEPEPSVPNIEQKLDELLAKLRRLGRRSKPAVA